MTLPYKYRGCLWLALLVVVLPYATWRFALRETFAAWRDCRRLTLLSADSPPAAFSSSIRADHGPELIFSGGLLDTLRRTAALHRVEVAGYEPFETPGCEGIAIHTAQVRLTGRFTDLCRVVLAVERALPHCPVQSLLWRSATDRRQRRRELMLTLYIRQIHFNP